MRLVARLGWSIERTVGARYMADMTLLELDGGKASLELACGEIAGVLRSLERVGDVVIERRATHEVIRVAGHDFVYVDEWDAPCLISGDAAGTTILASILHGDADRRAVRA